MPFDIVVTNLKNLITVQMGKLGSLVASKRNSFLLTKAEREYIGNIWQLRDLLGG